MTTGQIVLNGISDKELLKVLETKIRHEGKVFFNPQQIQPAQNPAKPSVPHNNNVIVSWHDEEGFKAVIGLQAELVGHRLAATEAA